MEDSSEIVLVGFSDLNTKLPATRALAPQSVNFFAFCELTPPSISIIALEFCSLINELSSLTLS